MKNIKTMIIGGDSKLGKALYEKMRNSGGYYPIVTSRRGNHADAIYLDMERADNIFIPDGVKIIYLFAAETSIDKCEQCPEKTASVNIGAVEKIIPICNEQNIKLIFPSTNLVFSGLESILTPDIKCHPACEYGRQKLLAEKIIRKECTSYLIVRLGKILDESNILFKKWKTALMNGETITAFNDLFIAPVTMGQAADFILKSSFAVNNEIIHFSASTQMSYYQIGLLLAETLKIPYDRIIAGSCQTCLKHQQDNVVLDDSGNTAEHNIREFFQQL